MSQDVISDLFSEAKTIAVVGLSADPQRPSHAVAHYLQTHGYRIIPVNPTHAGAHILSEHCYPTLTQAAAMLSEEGINIDVVDCFRRSEYILPIVEEAIAIRARFLWMQLGVANHEAAAKADEAGLVVVMNRCMKIEHSVRFRSRAAGTL